MWHNWTARFSIVFSRRMALAILRLSNQRSLPAKSGSFAVSCTSEDASSQGVLLQELLPDTVPREFTCPISLEVLRDPVVLVRSQVSLSDLSHKALVYCFLQMQHVGDPVSAPISKLTLPPASLLGRSRRNSEHPPDGI